MIPGTEFPHIIKVNIYQDAGFLVNGRPFERHVKTLKFYSVKEFDKFKKQNGL